jgi:hypothetical protein
MRSRLRAVIAVTIMTGLVLVVVGRVVAKSPEERDQIRAADQVAARFDVTLERYVTETSAAIKRQHDSNQDGYPTLLKLVRTRINAAPKVPAAGTTAYGRRASKEYRAAVHNRDLKLLPFAELGVLLQDHAIPDSSFVAAGKKLVRVSPAKLLGTTPIVTGAPLRDLVLPAFEKARARLVKQVAPKGSELLALDLKTYADDAISMTKDGAKQIDEGKAFFFNFGQRPNELYQRLIALEHSIQSDVAEKIELLGVTQ